MSERPQVVLIAAMDRNGVIGRDNQLPWRLSGDLKHFKARTLGCSIVMGRRTWDSIGCPLPGRLNLVLTRRADYSAPGAEIVRSVDEALARCAGQPRLCVIGGAEVYAAFLPLADRLELTLVETEVSGGDVFFPDWDKEAFTLEAESAHPADEKNEFAFRFMDYAKKSQTR